MLYLIYVMYIINSIHLFVSSLVVSYRIEIVFVEFSVEIFVDKSWILVFIVPNFINRTNILLAFSYIKSYY